MQVYRDKLGFVYTELDYYKDQKNLHLDLLNFPSINEVLKIDHEDFVASVPGFMTLVDLDQALIDMGLVSSINAPGEYSLSRILAEKLGENLFKQVLGLNLQHIFEDKETKTGGKVIKNVSGYDLSKIYLGSCNSLALINNVNLRLEKLPEYSSELSLSLPYAIHKNIIDLQFISFINHLASIDFDNSLNIALFFTLDSEENSSLELRVRISDSEELLEIKTKKLVARLVDFLKANYSDLNLLENVKVEKKPYVKKYPKAESKLEFYTKISDLIPLYRRLIENSKEKNKTLSAENKIRLVLHPKSSRIDLFCPRPILDSWLESLFATEFDEVFYLRVLPVSFKNKKLEFKYNFYTSAYENKLLRDLKLLYDPKLLVNPGILLADVK